MPTIPVIFESPRKENQEFKTILRHIESLRLTWAR